MSKIKEYFLNHLTEREVDEYLNQKLNEEYEMYEFHIKHIRDKILRLKLEDSKDNKLKIQKLQQELDDLTL